MASYFWEDLGPSSIPSYLSAGSATALRRLMLINNRKQKGFVRYFDIQYVAEEKRWYAWYIVKAGNELKLEGSDE